MKAKWLSGEALQIAVKRREAKSNGEKERYKHLNSEFQSVTYMHMSPFLWISFPLKDLSVSLDTIKLLEENIRRKIFFLSTPTVIKTKINKWDLIKFKTFCTAKEIENKTKRPPSESEKIFVKKATGKGLISKTDVLCDKFLSGFG